MGLFGGSSPPPTTVYNPAPIVLPPTPVTPPAANSPVVANSSASGAAMRAASAGNVGPMAGFEGTVATSPLGAATGPTASKTLLGA